VNLKNGKVFTSKYVGTGPSSYEKRIYRAAVSQRLRNTALHVSSNTVLIIRRSDFINTASGIVFCVSDCPVCRLRRNFLLNLHTGQSLTDSTIPDAVLIQFDLLRMSTELLETCRGL